MLNFENATFWHDPYPIGLIKPVMDETLYNQLVDNWPSESLFAHIKGSYNKYSLSEVNATEAYLSYIRDSKIWRSFYDYIKSNAFIESARTTLLANGIPESQVQEIFGSAKHKYRSRFEFSSLPAKGGFIMPHTDIPSKVVTLVIPMFKDGWDQSYGGGTDVLRPNKRKTYKDYQEEAADFDVVRTFQYEPNQCVFFLKTDNSWHSVGPFTGPEGLMRRTLTINIEKFKLK